jgi:hypothetical protein
MAIIGCPYLSSDSVINPLTEKESRERLQERKQWRRYVLSELRVNLQKQNEFEEIEERVDGKPKPFEVKIAPC